MLTAKIYGNTDVGKKRTHNEDTFIAQKVWDDNHYLAAVIDGVGGREGGEVAAETARHTLIEYLREFSNGERLSLLRQAVTQANNTIFEQRQHLDGCAEMSCVLTACLLELSDRRLNMAHVGDTRLYRYADGILEKRSHDHSFVGYNEENGILTETEAMHHPQRNLVNRVVGDEIHNVGDEYFIEAQTFPLAENDTWLLCSDGLSDMLTSQEITSVLEQDISPEEKANALIDSANQKGGKDNITVIIIQLTGNE